MTAILINVPDVGQVKLEDIEYHYDPIFRRWWFAATDALGRSLEVPLSALTSDQARWLATGRQGDPPGATGLDQKTLAGLVIVGAAVALLILKRL